MRRLVPPVALALGGALLIWLIRLLPPICPAVSPAPASCHPDARLGPAVVAIAVVAVLGVVDVVLAAAAPASKPARVFRVLLVAAIVIGAGATLVASGFALPLPG